MNHLLHAAKTLFLFLLTIAMIVTAMTTSYGADYSDISRSNWSYEAVNAMSEKGVIKGYPNGSFLPAGTVTYGEFIKMAVIAGAGQDVGNASKPDHWALNYYNRALELNYFTEHEIDKTQLNSKITRGDMALIISSILGDITISNYDEIQTGIKDITYQTEQEYDITKAYAAGILTGYTDNTFRPDGTLSRAESAAVIYRLVDESKREVPGGEKEIQTGKFEDMVSNADSFKNPGDGRINEDLAAAETYEIVTDGAKYGMELKENRGTTWIAIPTTSAPELHKIYLMKDGKIVELTVLSPRSDGSRVAIYHIDISQMDYIVSLDTITHHALLIVNPFQQ